MNLSYHKTGYVYSLYFTQGLFSTIVLQLSVVIFKFLGLNNQNAALLSSVLILPWLGKIFIAPYIERHFSLKQWLLGFQLAAAGTLSIIMLGLTDIHWFIMLTGFFLLGCFAMAYDISSDGIYLHTLTPLQQ